MDPSWVNAFVAIASFLTLLLTALITKLFSMTKELSDLKIHVAERYATKPEVKDLAERVERQIQTGFDQIYKLLEKREKS
ncbi:hypothetical protein [Aliivibrio sifiae]|uniref:Uncharacterized protein n=1 Tax=Aliivibrio sifiae TaxID=566293 RepID=A0A2S7XIC8_9GAMM|nr:hypothetical protein [Aliivibrio sifiae]PQJ93152.1 hypothetical protein BTO23_03390 [Aliivibrio sifiae]GLR75988.1 hypothetical protein GCM10007855_28620 [Aliivibrio sifiae]